LLRVQVSAEGKPLVVEVRQTSGIARLDNAAREAALKWRFVPARQGDQTMASWVEVPIQFSLQK
jgi:protein TonB